MIRLCCTSIALAAAFNNSHARNYYSLSRILSLDQCWYPQSQSNPSKYKLRLYRNLSTTLRQCRLRFTEQFLLFWMSRVG